ncbi:PilT/PilU family type 4a pilus ATPase [Candidatus Uhrbacteria bacterium]|nr:PilT/PilU family type 4a pilus ATPase [Candidatus Uhrbacteria bacterium]
MAFLFSVFQKSIDHNASDIHLSVGQKPCVRVHGRLILLEDERVVSREDMDALIAEIFTSDQRGAFAKKLESHRSYEFGGARFRVNAFFENGQPAIVARLIQSAIPTPGAIGLSNTVLELAMGDRGLILVTGATGSGKSTTLASIVNWINQRSSKNIITLEDPVEYIFESEKSLIKQREVGRDIPSFSESLKHIVRHDPDVIMVGEMRDAETMRAAITLAETGHLVLSTLHTASAAQTINRIIDSFPAEQQNQIRSQLALSLRGIISQKLVPSADGTRVAVREILVNTPAIAYLIRRHKLEQIESVMQTGASDGMQPLAIALQTLYRDGVISHATFRDHTAIG